MWRNWASISAMCTWKTCYATRTTGVSLRVGLGWGKRTGDHRRRGKVLWWNKKPVVTTCNRLTCYTTTVVEGEPEIPDETEDTLESLAVTYDCPSVSGSAIPPVSGHDSSGVLSKH